MYTATIDIDDKIVIIRNANISDATILNSNYKKLIQDTTDPDEQKEFYFLRENVQLRIKELTDYNE